MATREHMEGTKGQFISGSERQRECVFAPFLLRDLRASVVILAFFSAIADGAG
jgi:hypothetical protein